MKNRYLAFVFNTYEPKGGVDDLKGAFPTKEEAISFAQGLIGGNAKPFTCALNEASIYDCLEGTEVWFHP